MSSASHLRQTGSPPCLTILTMLHIASSPPSHQLGTLTPLGQGLFIGACPGDTQNQTKHRLFGSGSMYPADGHDNPETEITILIKILLLNKLLSCCNLK